MGFLDNMVVPAQNLIGEEGQGWSIMRTSLGHERATAFLADEFKYRRTVDQVLSLVVAYAKDGDATLSARSATPARRAVRRWVCDADCEAVVGFLLLVEVDMTDSMRRRRWKEGRNANGVRPFPGGADVSR